MELSNIKTKLATLSAQRDLLTLQSDNEKKLLSGLKKVLICEKKAHSVITNVAEEIQAEFGDTISDLVTSALNIVFIEDSYEFKVKFETKRNATSVNFTLFKNGKEQEIMNGSGGGIVSVISVALRFALFAMNATPSRNTILIDEGFVHLRGEENIGRVYDMLEKISSELGIQIIMVQNSNENLDLTERFNVIKIENIDGVARIV